MNPRQTTWTYSDILLEPTLPSQVSWKDVCLEARLAPFLKTQTPIVMAPMECIHHEKLHRAMSKELGVLPWIHRYMSPDEQALHVQHILKDVLCVAIAIGSKPDEYEARIELCGEAAQGKPFIVKIDVANGAYIKAIKAISDIKKKYPWLYIASGNVCTHGTAIACYEAGADAICVGIGGGSACTTRTQTGIGLGNGHAVHTIARRFQSLHNRPTIIADGGFRTPGDFVKALVLGADICMSGRLFQLNDYYGMASKTALDHYGKCRAGYEGEHLSLPPRSTAEICAQVSDTLEAIRSAMSYLGCRTVSELQEVYWSYITEGVRAESPAH